MLQLLWTHGGWRTTSPEEGLSMRRSSRARHWRAPILLLTVSITLIVALGAAAASSFVDVANDHPFVDEIDWMSNAGISTGWPDTTFRPTEDVTRQAMAAFMYRLAGEDPAVPPMVDAATLQGLSPADLTADAPLWAVVDPDGTLVRGSRVVSATSPFDSGQYEIIFDRPVDTCSYQATLGNAEAGNPPFGTIGVASRSGQPNGVFVVTYDDSGTIVKLGFHLHVVCTP